ncbi:MAG: dCTP deaminase [Elusimicrobia bacterium CG08_land_8_20_14_0_20_51_18]|nr:MAG: dCTP deaminase [Elusimicrobia bacterium CG08_land_8_20_14_0_20_51_18]
MLRSDKWIRQMCLKKKMISPFVEGLITKGKVSYGLSSYGYDIRVADEYKVFTDVHNTVIDPKEFSKEAFVDLKAPHCIVPPNSFALARSIEYFRIPRNVIGLCIGKSTYARCGIVVNITPLEPEWEGHLTLEISNTTPIPAKIYSNEGIAQLVFLGADEICEISYKDRKGKYQSQRGVTLPRMKK